jgi:hypothetical protein
MTNIGFLDLLKQKHDIVIAKHNEFQFHLEMGKREPYLGRILDLCNNEEKAKVFSEIMYLLLYLYGSPSDNNLRSFLHSELLLYDKPFDFKTKPYFTLSPHGKQLRCWIGPHDTVKNDHIDSNGKNLVFGVHASKATMGEIVSILEKIFEIKRFEFRHGWENWAGLY